MWVFILVCVYVWECGGKKETERERGGLAILLKLSSNLLRKNTNGFFIGNICRKKKFFFLKVLVSLEECDHWVPEP